MKVEVFALRLSPRWDRALASKFPTYWRLDTVNDGRLIRSVVSVQSGTFCTTTLSNNMEGRGSKETIEVTYIMLIKVLERSGYVEGQNEKLVIVLVFVQDVLRLEHNPCLFSHIKIQTSHGPYSVSSR